MKLLIPFILCVSAFAGDSLKLTGAQFPMNSSVTAQSANAPCRIEIRVVFTSSPTGGDFGAAYACGWTLQFAANSFQLYPNRPTGWSCCIQIPTSLFSSNWANIRVQTIPAGMGGLITWEAWDIAGVLQYSTSVSYTGSSGSNFAGAGVLSTGSQDTIWRFLRLYTTTVPMGSIPPLSSDRADLADYEFDGNLNDSSGNAFTLTGVSPAGSCGSTPCYTTTIPANPLVIATPRTASAASWATWGWFALKTGIANTLTGLLSYSQADSPGTLTYGWAQTVGASAPPSSSSASQPTVTPPSDGPYAYTLQVTDGDGNMSDVVPLTMGSVTQDADGVVTNSADAAKVFGPMIAFGASPWGWMDERAYTDVGLQTTFLTNSQYNPPPFTTRGTGTIAYKYGGSIDCTTLSGNINSTTLSIGVTDASCLNLSTLPGTPTDILVYNDGTSPRTYELMRICSMTVTTPPAATLTVCYDGRGVARASYSYGTTQTQQPASSHLAAGSGVGDSMTTGTSTLFVTDSSRPMCPGGAPGFPGPVQYSTGTLTMTASSAVVVNGSTATWNLANFVFAGQMIRIAATHASGSTFVFLATIISVDSTTQLTLSRAAPADIDASAFSYKIIGGTDAGGTGFYFGSWGIKIPGTSPEVDTNIVENVQLCESETRLSSDRYFEAGTMNGATQTGKTYSWKTTVGVTNGFALNFYGPGLALRAFSQRSGYAAPLGPANNLDDNWANDPEVCAGYCSGGNAGYTVMGGIIGAIADKVLNSSTTLEWDQLRNFGDTAKALVTGSNATNCNSGDARTVGAAGAIVALLALFDTAQQTHWNGILKTNSDSFYAWQQLCKDAISPNSWANQGGTFNASTGPTITAMMNDVNIVATSGAFHPNPTDTTNPFSYCTGGTSSGTATVTAGSDAMTAASGLVSGSGVQIVIDGTRLGQPFTLITDYQNNSGTSNTLGGLWPADADSGTVTWSLVASPWYTTSFGIDQDDATTTLQNFVCTYVDATHATLNRPWPFSSGTYHMFTYNIPGVVQQPFMLGGIFSHGLQWGALNADAAIAAAFNTELGQAAGWMYTTGFDPYAKGPFYARVNQIYEPLIVPSSNYSASYITSTVAPGTDPESIAIGFRELTGETSPTLRAVYTGTCSTTTKTWGDEAYGGLWGKDGFNAIDAYSDSISVGNHISASNLTDVYLGSYKWSGFFFGIGMAHQWPAVRTQTCATGGGSSFGGKGVTGGKSVKR